jgi:hypothetical protein
MLFWRRGVVHAYTPECAVLLACFLIPGLIVPVIVFASPQHLVPFQNRFLYTVGMCVSLFTDFIAQRCGSTKEAHPAEPHQGILTLVVQPAILTVRTMDALTDISIVRMVLEEKVCVR